MTKVEGADAGTNTQKTPDVSLWWQTVTPFVFADASRMINAFLEGMDELTTTQSDSDAFDLARAIAVKVSMADTQTLEALLARGRRVEGVLSKGLQATVDPRKDPEFKFAKQIAVHLELVLRMCAGMLPLGSEGQPQRQIFELADALRQVSMRMWRLCIRFGFEKPIRVPVLKIKFRNRPPKPSSPLT